MGSARAKFERLVGSTSVDTAQDTAAPAQERIAAAVGRKRMATEAAARVGTAGTAGTAGRNWAHYGSDFAHATSEC